MSNSKKISLDEDQIRFVVEMFKTTPDLKIITQKLFEDDSLDGRSQEGRAVRAVLVAENLKYKTSKGRQGYKDLRCLMLVHIKKRL